MLGCVGPPKSACWQQIAAGSRHFGIVIDALCAHADVSQKPTVVHTLQGLRQPAAFGSQDGRPWMMLAAATIEPCCGWTLYLRLYSQDSPRLRLPSGSRCKCLISVCCMHNLITCLVGSQTDAPAAFILLHMLRPLSDGMHPSIIPM